MAKEEVLLEVKLDEGESVTSINTLRNAVKQLTKERNELNLETDEGRARLNELNQTIDRNNKIIKENVDSLSKQRLSVGDYKNSIVDASKELNVFGVNVGSATTRIASFANPATAAVAVLSGLAAAYSRSSIGAKDLEFASNQLGAATSILTDKFAGLFSSVEDGEGIISKLTNGILFNLSPSLAIQSRLAAQAKENLDNIREDAGLVQEKINQRLSDNAEILTDIANKELTVAKRKELVLQAQQNISQNAKERIEVIDKELEQQIILRSLVEDTGNVDKEINRLRAERAQVEAGESKARERIEKQLNGILLQESKQNEIIDEQNRKLEDQNVIRQAQQEIATRQKELDELRKIDIENLGNETQVIKLEQLDKYLRDEDEFYQKEYEKKQEAEKKKSQLDILTSQNKLSNLSTVLRQVSGVIEKESGAYKLLAVSQASIDTYRAATAALAPPPVGAGPLFGPILAATTIGLGLANVAKIMGFAEGGVINGGFPIWRSNGDNRLITAKDGEVILNPSQQARLGGASTFRAIGVPGFADGGIVGGFPTITTPSITNGFDLTRLADIVSQQKIFVAVEDINTGQNNYANVVSRATF